MSLEDVQCAIRRAVDARFPPGASGPWPYTEATQDGTVIVDTGAGTLVALDWTIDDAGTVALGAEAKPVVEKTSYETVQASVSVVRALGGRKYRVRVMAMGLTKNTDGGLPVYFDDAPEQIVQASRLFAGAKVYGFKFADGTFDHLPDESVARKWLQGRNEYGYLTDPRVEGTEILATASLHDDVPAEILSAIDAAADAGLAAEAKPIGLSIDAACTRTKAVRAGQIVSLYTNFRHPSTHPASIDIVTSPAAKGEWLSRVAASIAARKEIRPMTLAEAIAVLDATTSTPEQRTEAQRVCASKIGATPVPAPTAPAATIDPAKVIDLESRVKAAEAKLAEATKASVIATAKAEAETLVRASKLPAKTQKLVLDAINPRIETDEAVRAKASEATQKLIDEHRDALSAVDSRVRGGRPGVEIGLEPRDKFAIGLFHLFDAPERVQKRYLGLVENDRALASVKQAGAIGRSDRVVSWKRLVRETMGVEVDDMFRHDFEGSRRVRASITTGDWADVFENTINKMGLAYQEDPNFGAWRRITKQTTIVGSTLKQERFVTGGYANLPAVPERGTYNAATSPGDHGQSYTVLKYGYTDDWTREMQINDNFGQLAEIVRKMALAADRTVDDYFQALVTVAGQPTMDYDSVALCHTSSHHSNLTTSALDASALDVARLIMKTQPDLSSGQKLGIRPRLLLVPEQKEKTAFDLLKPLAEYPGGSTTDNQWVRQFGLEVVVMRSWTNTGDWMLMADPMNSPIPVFEAGFLNGQQTSEIFVQDDPRHGSMFERDAITVKVRRDYFGGSPIRHEGFVLNDV